MIEGVTLGYITKDLLAQANDIALLRNNLNIVKHYSRKLIHVAGNVGLTVNNKKNEVYNNLTSK